MTETDLEKDRLETAAAIVKTAFSRGEPLVLAGAGRMGGAMLSGWLRSGLNPKAVRIIDPMVPPESAAILAREEITADATAPHEVKARVLVIAVKPQIVGDTFDGLKPLIGPDTILLSIAAGTRISTLADGFGAAKVIRTMPNTPAQIGRGVTAAVATPAIDEADKALAAALLSAMGKVAWVEDEALLDAVTAVSGSGPAYVFLLAEALAQAGVAAGLPQELAELLARETVAGSGELLHRSELTPAELRRNVTSPGGTTAAAMEVLMAEKGLAELMTRAVEAARRRSEELAG
jgi:pyrroline-5-carboxylate reductase